MHGAKRGSQLQRREPAAGKDGGAAAAKDAAGVRIESFDAAAPGQLGRLEPCRLEDLELGRVLGTGSFGRVSLARHRPTGAVVAVKALSKAHILKSQQALWGLALVLLPRCRGSLQAVLRLA